MSRENVEVAERAFNAVRRGDLDGFLALIDPGVQFTSLITEADRRRYSGHAAVRDWFSTVRDTFDDFESHPEEIREVGGDQLIVRLRMKGTMDGVRVEQTMWQAVQLRASLIAGWDVFRTERKPSKPWGCRSSRLRTDRHRRGAFLGSDRVDSLYNALSKNAGGLTA